MDYLVSAAALILFDQESPSPLACLNNCVIFIAEILDFSCSLGESPSSDAEARLFRCEKSRISTVLGNAHFLQAFVRFARFYVIFVKYITF